MFIGGNSRNVRIYSDEDINNEEENVYIIESLYGEEKKTKEKRKD